MQVLRESVLIVALRYNGHAPLRRPPQQHLRRRLAMLVGDLLHRRVLEEQRRVFCALHVQFDERLRAKGRVCRHGDLLTMREFNEAWLREIRVVFDLQGCGPDFGVAEQVQDELAVEVADADALGHALLHQVFHCRPGLLDRGITGDDVLAVVGEAWRVAVRGVDVFERDGEVDDVEVEIVDTPVLELLLADRRDAVVVVEGVPELGDEEQVGAFDESILDGPGYSLAGFDFVAVVWLFNSLVVTGWRALGLETYRMRRRRDGNPS